MSTGASRELRVAINGRMLGGPTPFVRLQSEHLVRLLTSDEGLAASVFVPAGAPLVPGLDSLRRDLGALSSPLGAAIFDQWTFPRTAARLGADVLVFPHGSAPFSSPVPTVAVWDLAGLTSGRQRGGRFLDSLAMSGLGGAAVVIRPSDVPLAPAGLRQVRLPPTIPDAFFEADPSEEEATRSRFGLPEAYVLTVCSDARSIPILLAAWTWVEGSMGDSHSLLFVGTHPRLARQVDEVARQVGVAGTVGVVSMDDRSWPAVVRGAAAFLDRGEAGMSAALRWALAAGVPVAGARTRISEAVLGPAGYLVDGADGRALGAACLTLLVEEQVADGLRKQGKERAAAYRSPATASAWRSEIRRAAGLG